MRDPARIDNILNEIKTIWLRNPDIRLGQLIITAINPDSPCPEVFYIEDADLVAKMKARIQ